MMNISNSSIRNQLGRVSGAMALALGLGLSTSFISQDAVAQVTPGATWEPVEEASVNKSRRIYVRGTGYYVDNQVTGVAAEDLSESLRLVVSNNTHAVTNADGTTDGGAPYFELNELSQSVRIYFGTARGTFNYDVALYQLVETVSDADQDGIPDEEDICPADAGNTCIEVTGMIFGGGSAISGADITVGANSVNTSTDLAGSFTANVGPLELSNDGVDRFFPVNVSAEGFSSGHAKVPYEEGVTSYDVTVTLKQVSDTITSEDDITEGVDITDGGENVGAITIPQAALPEGVTEVTGEITYLDPASDDILATPGGDLLALPEGGDPNTDDPVTLETFGMMEFDLQDQNGDEITELGGMAEVCMKATPGLELGETIPLWYYDEDKGLWIEEGEGSVVDRDGELMICGGVSHFSWWNYDRPITTHSCLRYDIQAENANTLLDGVEWMAEGATYTGTSPSRACSGGGESFDSFTVKVSTDSTQETIKVYTLLGGAKFYLQEDGDGTYSLTQDAELAEVFNTPTEQGSCLSGGLSGSCTPLDYANDADGILMVDAAIDLPPIISDFYFSNTTLFLGETADLQAMVIDPEGTSITATWSAECNYFGDDNVNVSISPVATNDPDLFAAELITPETIDYPLASCEVTLTATDENGTEAMASRWVVISSSFKFQISGTAFGLDGQPMANTQIEYQNWWCHSGEGYYENLLTDENGNYSTFIDLSDCGLNEYGYFDVGEFRTEFEYNGELWTHSRHISRHNDLRTVRCSIDEAAVTHCDIDMHLPTLWTPLTVRYFPPEEETFSYSFLWLHSNSGQGHNSSNTRYAYDAFDQDNLEYTTLVPAGDVYTNINTSEGSYNNSVEIRNLNGGMVDMGDVLTPVTLTVNHYDTDEPLANTEIQLRQWGADGEQITNVFTDDNGVLQQDLDLGWLTIGLPNPNPDDDYWYFGTSIPTTGAAKYIDINLPDLCPVSGRLIDRFNQPIANTEFRIFNYSYYWGSSFEVVSDENGYFNFEVEAGYASLQSVGDLDWTVGYWNQDIRIGSCRGLDGNATNVEWDIVGDEVYIFPRQLN